MGVVEVRLTQGKIDHPKDFKAKTPLVGIAQRGICQTLVVRFRQPLIFVIFEKFRSYTVVLKSIFHQKGGRIYHVVLIFIISFKSRFHCSEKGNIVHSISAILYTAY